MSAERGTSFVQELASEVIRQIQAQHVCVQEGRISAIAEQVKAGRDDIAEIKAAVLKMTEAIAENHAAIAVVRAERNLVSSLVAGAIGAGGSGGLVYTLMKMFQGSGPHPPITGG